MKLVTMMIFVLAACAMVQATEHHRRHHRRHPRHDHHHHHDHHKKHAEPAVKVDVEETKEASDLKAVMEGVKATTDKEAGVVPKGGVTDKDAKVFAKDQADAEAERAALASNQDDHAVDQKILGEAASMEKMMFAHDGLRGEKKATGLVKVDQKTEEDRAALYFATHGMGKVGKMLGETLSGGEAASAAKMIKSAEKMEKQSSTNDALDSVSIDMDDEEDAAAKAQWAKVDTLRRKAAFRGA